MKRLLKNILFKTILGLLIMASPQSFADKKSKKFARKLARKAAKKDREIKAIMIVGNSEERSFGIEGYLTLNRDKEGSALKFSFGDEDLYSKVKKIKDGLGGFTERLPGKLIAEVIFPKLKGVVSRIQFGKEERTLVGEKKTSCFFGIALDDMGIPVLGSISLAIKCDFNNRYLFFDIKNKKVFAENDSISLAIAFSPKKHAFSNEENKFYNRLLSLGKITYEKESSIIQKIEVSCILPKSILPIESEREPEEELLLNLNNPALTCSLVLNNEKCRNYFPLPKIVDTFKLSYSYNFYAEREEVDEKVKAIFSGNDDFLKINMNDCPISEMKLNSTKESLVTVKGVIDAKQDEVRRALVVLNNNDGGDFDLDGKMAYIGEEGEERNKELGKGAAILERDDLGLYEDGEAGADFNSMFSEECQKYNNRTYRDMKSDNYHCLMINECRLRDIDKVVSEEFLSEEELIEIKEKDITFDSKINEEEEIDKTLIIKVAKDKIAKERRSIFRSKCIEDKIEKDIEELKVVHNDFKVRREVYDKIKKNKKTYIQKGYFKSHTFKGEFVCYKDIAEGFSLIVAPYFNIEENQNNCSISLPKLVVNDRGNIIYIKAGDKKAGDKTETGKYNYRMGCLIKIKKEFVIF